MIYAIYKNTEFKKQVEYIFNIFLSVYGIPWRIVSYSKVSTLRPEFLDLVISYYKEEPTLLFKNHIHIYESPFFFSENYLKPDSIPKTPLKRYKELPVIYYGCGNFNGFVRKSGNLIETNIDIIASSFLMLSRYEEIVLDKKDKFDRFPASESLAYKEEFLDRPIVNEYIELFWKWIDSFRLGFKRKKIWEGKDFAVCLTHDVDTVRKYKIYPPLRAIGSLVVKDKDLRKAFAVIIDYFRAKLGKDPYGNFSYIMDLENKHGFKSSFYFINGGNTEHDASYSIENLYIISLIKSLQKEDFEVGLHPSFNSYNNFRMLNLEKERLEKASGSVIFGGRQHCLRWKTPDTWGILEKAGLKYDTTLSFAEHEGFRCGICFPYKPFDILENRVLNIWELPLIIMDGSLFDYQNLTPEEGFQQIKNLIDTVKKYNGLFVLLWHNSSLDDLKLPGWIEVYEKTIEYLGRKNVFNAPAKGIIDWWGNNIS